MRTSSIPGFLIAINWNLNRKNKNLKIFEIGHSFHWIEKGRKHEELTNIAFAITGMSMEKNWLESPRSLEFFDIKGDIEIILDRIGIKGFAFKKSEIPFLDRVNSKTGYKDS